MTGIFAFYKNNFNFFQKNSFTSLKFYYLCPQIATMLHQKTTIMGTITTRKDILEFLIDVEMSPKKILSVSISNEWLSKTLKSMLESYLLEDDYNKKDFDLDLQVVTRTVFNKFN
tara:strand:- start:418 stop:762 length:345 start_codon:yes stop_codon:yes gene_type:complete